MVKDFFGFSDAVGYAGEFGAHRFQFSSVVRIHVSFFVSLFWFSTERSSDSTSKQKMILPIERPKLRLKFRPFNKNWRQPTLAEPIELLPSARLCLTAEFGMGSGRTTALLPPKIVRQSAQQSAIRLNRTNQRFKEQMPECRHSLKIAHRRNKVFYRSRVKIAFLFLAEKEKAIKPNDRLVLVR